MIRRLSELARRMGGSLVGPDAVYSGFALDNRSAQPGDVFIAVQGERVDGHMFSADALKAGCVATVATRTVDGTHVLVDNTVDAIGRFGASIRAEFSGPVIGITGSNGKTTAKEMVAAAIGSLGKVLKNPGNFNSELTSPLTWNGLDDHAAAVIEMGMRGAGQIRHLAQISKPTHALITMIGTAHIELLGSRQAIAEAKGELFECMASDGQSFCWHEDEFRDALIAKSASPTQTFGFGPDADCQVLGYRAISLTHSRVMLRLMGESIEFDLPVIGRHNALNAAAAMLIAANCGVKIADAAQGISQVVLPPMRMEIVEFKGATILLDTYNASPDSMEAALATLAELPTSGRKLALLGEMKELGKGSKVGHARVGAAAAKAGLDFALFYGEPMRDGFDAAAESGMPLSARILTTSFDDLRDFVRNLNAGDLLLIKGSRALELETLLEQTHA